MSFCTNCRNRLDEKDKFCGRCSTPVRRASDHNEPRNDARGRDSYRGQPTNQAPRRPFVPALETDAGKAAFNALMALKQANVSRKRKIAGSLVVVCLLVGCGAAAAHQDFWPACVVIGFISFLVLALADVSGFSEQEYYSIPGTKDGSGEHRCIYCGHRGIYRHGQYKTNNEYADCSKCKKNLWRS